VSGLKERSQLGAGGEMPVAGDGSVSGLKERSQLGAVSAGERLAAAGLKSRRPVRRHDFRRHNGFVWRGISS